MSIIASAFSDWRECRADFDLTLQAAYDAAEEGCRGALLNDRGRRKGIDSMSLFLGPAVRAYAYASEELVEWWQSHPRVTFAEFERQWLALREVERWR